MIPLEQTVLIVDDDRTNRMILAGVLKDEYHVILAKDGASALRLLGENDDICLVLLDITMPEMDGYEVLQKLKGDRRTADIPVVFITGNAEEKEEEHGLLLGAADYVSKPVRPAIVRARIRNLLKTAALGRMLTSSRIDASTGLSTRTYFEEALSTICALAVNAPEPLGLVLVEIDSLDPASAQSSWRIGGLGLKRIARCIGRHAEGPCEVAARYGETSFALLLPRAAKIGGTLEKIRRDVQSLDIPGGAPSVRIGAITTRGTKGLAAEALLRKAQAMLAEAGSKDGDGVALSHLDSP